MIFLLDSETELEGAICPWRVRVQPGQKVKLTLYDFAAEDMSIRQNSHREDCIAEYAQVCLHVNIIQISQKYAHHQNHIHSNSKDGVLQKTVCLQNPETRYLCHSNPLSITDHCIPLNYSSLVHGYYSCGMCLMCDTTFDQWPAGCELMMTDFFRVKFLHIYFCFM